MEEQQQRRTAWERQLLIRDKNRPTVRDYIPRIFTDFYEMHGDRNFGDDGAIIGGIGRLDGIPVTVLAQVKGRNLRENKASNFAMPHPEGYRKALRLAHQAEKFHRPVICLIDTPGAFCGVEAEERGQGEAIARNIAEFMMLKPGDLRGAGRGWQRRRTGAGRMRRPGNAGECALLRDLAPWRSVHSVEGCVQRAGGVRSHADHCRRYGAVWRGRGDHSGA